jgi:uncharacterized protein (DUF1778 family)
MNEITITDKAATQMMGLLENPPEPNTYLLRAKANYNSHIISVQANKSEKTCLKTLWKKLRKP